MTVERSTDALSLRKGSEGCEHVLPRQQLLVAAVRLEVLRLEWLEPYEGKLSRTVLRGGRTGNGPPLLGFVRQA